MGLRLGELGEVEFGVEGCVEVGLEFEGGADVEDFGGSSARRAHGGGRGRRGGFRRGCGGWGQWRSVQVGPSGSDVGEEVFAAEADVVVLGKEVDEADGGGFAGFEEGAGGAGDADEVGFVEFGDAGAGDAESEADEVEGVAGDSVEAEAEVGVEVGAPMGKEGGVEALAAVQDGLEGAAVYVEAGEVAKEEGVVDLMDGPVGDAFEAFFEIGDGVGLGAGASQEEKALVVADHEFELVGLGEACPQGVEFSARDGESVLFDERQG